MLGCTSTVDDAPSDDAPSDDAPLDYGACAEVKPAIDAIEHPDTERFDALFIEALRASPYSKAATLEHGEMIRFIGDTLYCVQLSVRVDWFAIRHRVCFDHAEDDAMTQAFAERIADWPEPPAVILPLDEVEAIAEGCFPGIVEPYEPCGDRPKLSFLVGYSIDSPEQPTQPCLHSSDVATVDLVRGELAACRTEVLGGCDD